MADASRFIPAKYLDTIELWQGEKSGVLQTEPLLLAACRAGCFGEAFPYPGGAAYRTLFVYLDGVPDGQFFREHPELFFGTFLVTMSGEWERFLLALPHEKLRMARWLMDGSGAGALKEPSALPAGYALSPFDGAAYALRPFGHGENYKTYADFAANGAGAVVRFGGEIAASASSFLTFQKGVEIDVSTLPEQRKKGLAAACVNSLLQQCRDKGLVPHWDAQNGPSRRLAERFGFTVCQRYAVTMLAPEE